MLGLSFSLFLCQASAVLAAGLSESSLETHVDSLALDFSFKPVKEAYWTSIPHHRRTPFAVSPDGKSAYLAYLDSSETDVHVQQVDPSTFATVGSTVTVTGGKEAGGLVAHNDGFALLTNEALPSGTANAPADSTPVPVLYRYTGTEQTWKTFLGGPGVHEDFGLAASPDLNGDLVFSEEAGLYGAYFVVTDYTGDAAGHFGDSIQYVATDGALQTIQGASSSWGCSHNTGIAFEAAAAAPFASLCAEDQGAIWLNTATQGMTGVKVSNENTTNGGSGEPMGGMSGSYSALARLGGANASASDAYVFAWVSRGATELSENEWLGAGFTHALNRTNGRNVAIARFSDKNTLVGAQASSEVGATGGDAQVNWITQGTADCSNAHVAAFNDGESVLVAWEEIAEPICEVIAMGCRGTFSGSKFLLVTSGVKVGEPVSVMDTFVAGDMVTMADGRICWPYVSMDWSLSEPVAYGGSTTTTTQMSFACMNLDGGAAANSTSSASTPVASSSESNAENALLASAPASNFVSSVAPTATSDVLATPVVSETADVITSVSAPVSLASENPVLPSQSSAPIRPSCGGRRRKHRRS
ncbi:hypothetical protein F5B20DRAFT_47369 [Whalleya microplaca]|nr:hypothetical protein F5B20DRAFT_47369 [Whalleya microplaca]